MKSLRGVHTLASTRGLAAGLLSFGALLADSAVCSPGAPTNPAGEAKTHTLFMGADFLIERNKEFVRVEDVAGGSFIVNVKDERVPIPMNRGTVNMRINSTLKLTEVSATVANLKGERSYTPGNDPYRKFANQQPGGSGMAQASLASGRLNAALNTQASAQTMANNSTGPAAGFAATAVSNASAGVASATAAYDAAAFASSSDYNDVGVYAGKLQAELDQKLYDAIELTFEISAAVPLNSAYVVIVAVYHDANAKPGEVRNWIYAQSIAPIGPQPQHVHILRGGFPPGFELKSHQLHLYNNGVEIATNVAAKRIPLTRDEAAQYAIIEYISGHKNATLPAAPLMGKLPADLPARISGGQFAQPFYVKVSKEGRVVETFLDESCLRKTDDPYIASLMKALHFKPALDKGKPVEGVVSLNLRSLSI